MPASLLAVAIFVAIGCSSGDDDATGTTSVSDGTLTASAGSPDASTPQLDPTSAAGITREPSPEVTPRQPVPPQNSGETTLAIDASSITPAVDAASTQNIGSAFDVVVVLGAAGAPYVGFQLDLGWDPAIIAFDAFANAAADVFPACSPTRASDGAVAVACLRPDVTEDDYTGALGRFTLRCIAPGAVVLRLREPGEGSIGTRIESKPTSSFAHVLAPAEATITCV